MTDPRNVAGRFTELCALLPGTWSTMRRTGCTICGSLWITVFPLVRGRSTPAPSYAVGQAYKSHRALLRAVPHRVLVRGTARPPPWAARTVGPHTLVGCSLPTPPPSSTRESTPRRGGTRRATRHVCLHQPQPTATTLPLYVPYVSRSRPVPAAPVGVPEALQGRGCADPWARRARTRICCETGLGIWGRGMGLLLDSSNPPLPYSPTPPLPTPRLPLLPRPPRCHHPGGVAITA